jgi:nucleoside 2-deoxyribosyltransferase
MNNISIIIVVAASVLLSLFGLVLFFNIRKRKYDEEKNKAVIEGIRDSFEQKIYSLNDRMMQSEERWRDVNHLLIKSDIGVTDQISPTAREVYLSDFLKANGITKNQLQIDERLVFVLTPFHERYYKNFMIIKDLCTSYGFNSMRGDEKEFKGDIFPKMLEYIVKARIVIANISGRNANVLYELGVAQALDKPVILIAEKPEELPIDVQSQRFVIYSNPNELRDLLKIELQKFM